MGRGPGVKGAHCTSHAVGRGAKGKGKGPDIQAYVEINKQITITSSIHAAQDKIQFSSLLDQLTNNRVKLDMANIATILHRSAKLRLGLPSRVIIFLATTLNEVQCLGNVQARQLGNALYGLQRLGDTAEVRQLVAALTPKVQRCREELRTYDVDRALSELGDSDEGRDLLLAFVA